MRYIEALLKAPEAPSRWKTGAQDRSITARISVECDSNPRTSGLGRSSSAACVCVWTCVHKQVVDAGRGPFAATHIEDQSVTSRLRVYSSFDFLFHCPIQPYCIHPMYNTAASILPSSQYVTQPWTVQLVNNGSRSVLSLPVRTNQII